MVIKNQKKRTVCSILAMFVLTLSACTNKKEAIELFSNDEEVTYLNETEITGIGDPYAFIYNNMYYVTATSNGKQFELFESPDMKEWSFVRKIFNTSYKDGWVRSSLWQPQVIIGEDGKFYLYYCGNNEDGSLRIGVAGANSVEGPFVDLNDKPLFDLGYATIDPYFFADEDGQMYLYYSRDCSENIVDGRNISQIYVVQMESHTKVKEGAEHKLLLSPEQEWELKSGDWRWNEAPDILKHNNQYYLFYSANFYASSEYSIGYAVADQPEGPFEKYDNNPVLSATMSMSGPGNNSFFYSLDGKELFTAYHTHTNPIDGGGDRKLTIDRCGFREDGTFYINGPTEVGQPEPSGEKSLIKDIIEIEVSSSEEGKRAELLVDGAISKSSMDTPYEWTTAVGDEKRFLDVEFEEEYNLREIVLYRCFEESKAPQSLKIILDDGIITNVTLPSDVMEPVILSFDARKTKHVKIEVDEMGTAENFGLAEIMFFQ